MEFVFGEDGLGRLSFTESYYSSMKFCSVLDPALMEAKNGSVIDFTHQLEHVRNTHPFNGDEELDSDDMTASCVEGQGEMRDNPIHQICFRRSQKPFLMPSWAELILDSAINWRNSSAK